MERVCTECGHVGQPKPQGLGSFIEIEAIDEMGNLGLNKLNEQCAYYIRLFGVNQDELMTHSYSDMILELNGE